MSAVTLGPKKLLVSPTEQVLNSHTGRFANCSENLVKKLAASGNQAWLCTALPSTTA